VPDATLDKRFAKNPLVTSEPKSASTLGAPLITPDGYALGTLCVIDKSRVSCAPDQKQLCASSPVHVMTQLELRRHSANGQRAQEREEIQSELKKAHSELAKVVANSKGTNPRLPPAERRKPLAVARLRIDSARLRAAD